MSMHRSPFGSLPVLVGLFATFAPAQEQDERPEPPPRPTGVTIHEPEAFDGYTLITPLKSRTIFLVDMDGNVVNQWDTDHCPGSEYLLSNGNLLRCAKEPDVPRFSGGGQGGRFQELDWDGNVVWDWTFVDDTYLQHHDIAITPDDTILFIAWDLKSPGEAVRQGRKNSALTKAGMWPDMVVEIERVGADEAEILWEWRTWDHLIQDQDPEAANFGVIAEHPERIDINLNAPPEFSSEELEKMQALGYVGGNPTAEDLGADWMHTNAIYYNADLDQIALSVPRMGEIWIIDHSTTIEEAASSEGGNSGMGGDLLYRWGNPMNYGMGEFTDTKLFYQHDVRWIPEGYPGAGNLMIFNNGGQRLHGEAYSAILELELPFNGATYDREDGQPFGPEQPVWEYTAPDKKGFFSGFISGAHRLPNGNTFICEGDKGRVFEVTSEGKIVWEFWHDLGNYNLDPGGQPAPPVALFRATRIAADHPGLAGKDLSPKELRPRGE